MQLLWLEWVSERWADLLAVGSIVQQCTGGDGDGTGKHGCGGRNGEAEYTKFAGSCTSMSDHAPAEAVQG